MHRRTKALAITKAVKERVWQRDGQRCVLCGSCWAFPEAHYIARAQSGLGIEENIVTLCRSCYDRYDNSTMRAELRVVLGRYLQGIYPGWSEDNLIYRKWTLC